ncbi:MAG: hypothetical protein ACRDOU_28295 [Streptosporangiaceae bacterium]
MTPAPAQKRAPLVALFAVVCTALAAAGCRPKSTNWYIQYAGTSMVIAYSPTSKYASQYKAYADGSKPLSGLFTLLETPGLKLGRTDPNIDPQGRDFIYMLELARPPSRSSSTRCPPRDWRSTRRAALPS